MDILIRDTEKMLPPDMDVIGYKHAARIWGFISKFVMLDRFGKTLGLAKVHPGLPCPRTICSLDFIGTGAKVSFFLTNCPVLYNHFQILDDLNPPTKILRKFLKTWGERNRSRTEYSRTSSTKPSVVGQDSAGVALLLSRRLIAVVKVKNILQIEAGLEMIALAMAISSEVNNINMYNPF